MKAKKKDGSVIDSFETATKVVDNVMSEEAVKPTTVQDVESEMDKVMKKWNDPTLQNLIGDTKKLYEELYGPRKSRETTEMEETSEMEETPAEEVPQPKKTAFNENMESDSGEYEIDLSDKFGLVFKARGNENALLSDVVGQEKIDETFNALVAQFPEIGEFAELEDVRPGALSPEAQSAFEDAVFMLIKNL